MTNTGGATLATGSSLAAEGVNFAYGHVKVLFGVTLAVNPGEMLGLLGTNGAGKSTLLRVISGLSSPSSGTVVLNDADVTGASAPDMVRRGVVLVQGGKAVFPDLTVEENLAVGSHIVRHDRRLGGRRESVLTTFPDLRPRLRTRAGSLSGGEQQQLALAKALLLEPTVLLIDELSLGLAPVMVERLLGLIREINQAGTTVILVEQSLNVAASLCDRAVFLERGEVRFEGRASDLLHHDIARAVFLSAAEAQS